MDDAKMLKQPSSLDKKIKLAVAIVVLVLATAYASVRFLALMYTNWGTELYSQGKLDEAMVQYERALKVSPGFKPARTYLRDVCIEKADSITLANEHVEAERLYKRAIDLDADANDVHWKLATTYWRQGKKAEALASLEEHLKRKPNDELALSLQRILKGDRI